MKQLFLLTTLFFSISSIVAQPQLTDAPMLNSDDIVITVIESTDECGIEPGVYQLHENGYTKITSLEPMSASAPNLTLRRNSSRVLEVLDMIGKGELETRDYREFWIDECSKQSQYVLSPRQYNYMVDLH